MGHYVMSMMGPSTQGNVAEVWLITEESYLKIRSLIEAEPISVAVLDNKGQLVSMRHQLGGESDEPSIPGDQPGGHAGPGDQDLPG